MTKPILFVSHSSKEALLARKFKDFIQTEIFEDKIKVFVSSRPGDLERAGEWLENIMNHLDKAKAVIFLPTQNTFQSDWVWFEIGVTYLKYWRDSIKPFCLCGPWRRKNELRDPLSRHQAIDLNDEEDFRGFVEDLLEVFGEEKKDIDVETFISEMKEAWESQKRLSNGDGLDVLRAALEKGSPHAENAYEKVLNEFLEELKNTCPKFFPPPSDSKATNAFCKAERNLILKQVDDCKPILAQFAEACLLASNYKQEVILKKIYGFFGNFYMLYFFPPQNSLSSPCSDGYKFIVHLMFISFIAALIKKENWKIAGGLLREKIHTQVHDKNKMITFNGIRVPLCDSIQRIREEKAQEIIGSLSLKIDYTDFLEADGLLSLCSLYVLGNNRGWYPDLSMSSPKYSFEYIERVKAGDGEFTKKLVEFCGGDLERFKVAVRNFISEIPANKINFLGEDWIDQIRV